MRKIFCIDTRALAFVRVAAGSLLVFDLIDRSRDLKVFYSISGLMQDSTDWFDWLSGHFTIFGYVHSDAGVAVVFVIHAVAALAVIVGYQIGRAHV